MDIDNAVVKEYEGKTFQEIADAPVEAWQPFKVYPRVTASTSRPLSASKRSVTWQI